MCSTTKKAIKKFKVNANVEKRRGPKLRGKVDNRRVSFGEFVVSFSVLSYGKSPQ